MKDETSELLKRAKSSLLLAIELFNRPFDLGRPEAVLLLSQHAVEMLLKAAVQEKTGTLQKGGERFYFGFDKCLNICREQKLLSDDEAQTLSILDTSRDISAHYYQDMTEDLLYTQVQAAVACFDAISLRAFGERLADWLPKRILPISVRPIPHPELLLDQEFSQVDALLRDGKTLHAKARLRSVAALAYGSRPKLDRLTEDELDTTLSERTKGTDWKLLLPELAHLQLVASGGKIPVYLKISREEGLPVRVVKDGEPAEGFIVKTEVNLLDKFTLGRDDLAEKLGISGPKVSALIAELGIQAEPRYYREFKHKTQTIKAYSKEALSHLETQIEVGGIDVEAIWAKHRPRLAPGRPKGRKQSR